MSTCNCSLRTKLVGDGCAVCSPELAERYALEREPLYELPPLCADHGGRWVPGCKACADDIDNMSRMEQSLDERECP